MPPALQCRRVEITGPVDAKMVINAFNSGADTYMTDFEDSNSPLWTNQIQGQINIGQAIRRTLSFTQESATGTKTYRLDDKIATLQVRPRGWHLDEKHVTVDGKRVSGGIFDFALFMFHNAKEQLARGAGPYFYLPKMESHLEARLWNDIFVMAQEELGLPQGTIKATVLIETILAAFEMDEILYELREHWAGLNAGRWDYIFSCIKKFKLDKDFCLADRAKVTMTAPFMRAYALLLLKTCHQRGAPAIGGMSALIPIKNDPEKNAIAMAGIVGDKQRDAMDGYDGGWVAHPGLVEPAMKEFLEVLGDKPNQIEQAAPDVAVSAADLLDFQPEQPITEAGLRMNINVGIHYLGVWLAGNGCVPIHNLMEDAATAEISRSPGVAMDPQAQGRAGRRPQGHRCDGAQLVPRSSRRSRPPASKASSTARRRSSPDEHAGRVRRVPDAAAVRGALIRPSVDPVHSRDALARRFGPSYRWRVLVTVMIGTVASVMASTIVNVAVPDMARVFTLGQERAQWLSAGFMGAMTLSMLTTPWLLGRYGYRHTYIGAVTLLHGRRRGRGLELLVRAGAGDAGHRGPGRGRAAADPGDRHPACVRRGRARQGDGHLRSRRRPRPGDRSEHRRGAGRVVGLALDLLRGRAVLRRRDGDGASLPAGERAGRRANRSRRRPARSARPRPDRGGRARC